jgi:ryanodine receptor 2
MDIIGCALDLNVPEIRFTLNGNPINGHFRDFNVDGLFFPVVSMSAKVRFVQICSPQFVNKYVYFSCRLWIGGNQGRLRHGPPPGFSALYEAIRGDLEIIPCFSFGETHKTV